MFNEDCLTEFPKCDRILAIGDVHGDIERLMDCLYAAKIIDTNGVWTADPKNTMVVQLGDQVDSHTRVVDGIDWERVPDYEVIYFMDKLDRQARLHGGRVISLLGNHEIMNTLGDFSYVSAKSMDPLRHARFRPGGSIAQIMARRCVIVKIGSVLFVHGGILPNHISMLEGNIHTANVLIRKYLRGHPMSDEERETLHNAIIGESGILWTRVYTTHGDIATTIDQVLRETGCSMICTGHNTVDQITPLYGGKLWFLDAGLSRAYGTHKFQALEILNDGTEFKILDMKK